MFNVKEDIQPLRELCHQAAVSISFSEKPFKTGKDIIPKYLEYHVDYGGAKITPEEHDALFPEIKKMFGDRLIERYSQHTGNFIVYVRYPEGVKNSNVVFSF